jgi:hypothetical protein
MVNCVFNNANIIAMEINHIESLHKQFAYYKLLAEKAIMQIPDQALFCEYNPQTNSIAIIVSHMVGNMLSRFTDFLTSDGEKPWRQRDAEFQSTITERETLMVLWEEGWDRLFSTMSTLNASHLNRIVYIRNEGHTVTEALNRQLAHYAYHVGQIVFIAKMAAGDSWTSLTIPKGNSHEYNQSKLEQEKTRRHFTDGL